MWEGLCGTRSLLLGHNEWRPGRRIYAQSLAALVPKERMTCSKCASQACVVDNDDIRLPDETWVKCIIFGNRWEASGRYAAQLRVLMLRADEREARGRFVNVARCRMCRRPCGAGKSVCWWHQSYAVKARREVTV